jgi:phosphoribosylaminoimidazolecarboxamide formyltransferase/IMP cyclohydrolase
MTEIKLRYGCNPHQGSARLLIERDPSPLRVVCGSPGYINVLDALAAWQLARELKAATGLPGAASFKHVSPAGAAVARPLSDGFRLSQMIPETDLSPVATAYARARGGDRMCSFGDVGAVSEAVDASLARLIRREVSDAFIAPGYTPEALEVLKAKKDGKYLVLEIDADYEPPAMEDRDAFGFRLEQERNTARIDRSIIKDVVSAKVIGMGAGQQSRVHCTRLACGKAEKWLLQQHPRVLDLPFKDGLGRIEKTNVVDSFLLWDELADAEKDAMLAQLDGTPAPLSPEERANWVAKFDGICLSSDAFIPFRDTIDRASRTNVRYVLQTGGSLRDEDVTAAADQYGMVMVHSGLRLFLH